MQASSSIGTIEERGEVGGMMGDDREEGGTALERPVWSRVAVDGGRGLPPATTRTIMAAPGRHAKPRWIPGASPGGSGG